MVSEWLLSPDHFCVAPGGDFAGNADECYWGLPSIQRGATLPSRLWATGAATSGVAVSTYGYVWGPMAQLVYCKYSK